MIETQSLEHSILTDEHLNALRTDGTPDPDIFVIGDAGSIDNAPLPATAQGQWP